MKHFLAITALFLLPLVANADIEYRSWNAETKYKTLVTVGLHTSEGGFVRVALNFEDGSQLLLTGPSAHVGLALTNHEGQCITILREQLTVSLIPNCKGKVD